MKRFVNQLLQFVLRNKNYSIYELIDNNDASLLEFLEIYKNIKNFKSQLSSQKTDLIKKIKNLECSNCQSTGLVFDSFFKEILIQFKKITKNRPPAIAQYDQAFIKAEDVIKRVEFIYQRGDLLNSKILVIGDDDLISIALGLTKLAEFIYVIEIDQRLINFINDLSQRFNLNIKAMIYDVRNPLPKDLINKFDVFVSDPVETEEGLKHFLMRGMLSLNKNGVGYFGLTTLESSLKKWFKIEEFILKNGFVITDIKRKFSVYPIVKDDKSWKLFEEKLPIYKILKKKSTFDWYKSGFIRIERIKETKIVNKKISLSKKFYIDKEALATPIV